MAESAAREEEEQLVKKKGAHSIIRTWFGFKVSDTEQKNVYCKLCKKTVVANGGNTGLPTFDFGWSETAKA